MAEPVLLHGDVPAAVRELKQTSSGNLVILGSGELISSLVAADLIDEYMLMIHHSCSAPAGACSPRACAHRYGSPTASPRPRAC